MAATGPQQPTTTAQKLAAINEQTWLSMGNLAEMMTDYEKAMNCYESALRHNPYSIVALTQIASLCRGREQFARAVEYFKRILAIQENNGETWAALGHCYLMMDNLQEAYHAYQQALYHLSNPKDPKLWYGIGILYDRYGSLEHAEEAFSAVMKMDPKFEKANEIYFRLGIIYKQQQKFDLSLQCFRYILQSPPRPLTESDIWFQTGHVYEQQKEYEQAKEAYERVLAENPEHAKVLQQLGWLYHQQNTSFCNQSLAITYLTRSLKSDSNDAQSWYLLGRCYMAEQNYNKAYEAYQQAVYRDARNPTFWCSIGVLYYQINQYRDALDAYSRAIRLNPYISEVWYDLGTLYESCNNQIQDALDAYQRAAELDPSNPHIKQRLELLRKSQSHTQAPGSAPTPQDVSNPSQYQSGPNAQPLNGPSYGQTTAPSGPPSGMSAYQTGTNPPQQRSVEDRGPPPHLPMSLPPNEANSGPGRDLPMPNGPPPPPPQQQQQQQQQQQLPASGTGRRSPGPYPPSYPPSTSREDVRIPDIGNGGGRAPTPSERSQMNPIMQDNGRPHPQHSAMPGPPPSHSGQPGGVSGLHQAPYGKPNPSEGTRSPNVSGDSNGRAHTLASPHSRSSGNLHHGASPKQYDSLPQQHHHRSPGMSHAEQQQQQQHGYEMSPHHPEYEHSVRHGHPSSRPSAADSHYPSRQEPLPHSPSPSTYSRSNHPADPYHRGPHSAMTPSEETSALPPPPRQQHADIKQEHDRSTHRSPQYEAPLPPTQQQREIKQQYNNSPRQQQNSRRESERYDHHPQQPQHHHYQEPTSSSRATGGRTTDDDYDASAADMLLSIGQSRGDKRTYPSDETKTVEETKRPRPTQDEQDTDHPMTTNATSSPSKDQHQHHLQHYSSPPPPPQQQQPAVDTTTQSTSSPPTSSPQTTMHQQSSSPAPAASSRSNSLSSKQESSTHEPSSSSSSSSSREPGSTATAIKDEPMETATTPTTSSSPPAAAAVVEKKEEDTKAAEEEDEEEEGELRDETEDSTKDTDVEMKEPGTKEDEKEEGEVPFGQNSHDSKPSTTQQETTMEPTTTTTTTTTTNGTTPTHTSESTIA